MRPINTIVFDEWLKNSPPPKKFMPQPRPKKEFEINEFLNPQTQTEIEKGRLRK